MGQQKKTLCIAGSMILPLAIGQPAVIWSVMAVIDRPPQFSI